MDDAFIRQVIPLYQKAALLTLGIGGMGIVLSMVVGLFCALVRYHAVHGQRRRSVRGGMLQVANVIVVAYTELSRNTPLLIQLFFLYFAFPRMGILLSSEQCGIIGLTFLGGSYMAETFRSALETVSRPQLESGACIGLTQLQIVRYVVVPQAAAVSVPGLCANIMFLIKETSVFSAVALADLMYVAKDLIGLYYKTDESLLLLVLAYAVLLVPVAVVSSFAERRLRRGQFGNV